METSQASSQRHLEQLGARLQQEQRGAASRQEEAEALRAQLDALRREVADLRAQLLQREGQAVLLAHAEELAEHRARETREAIAEASRQEERAVAAAAAQQLAEGAAAAAREECEALREQLGGEQRAHRKVREQQEVQGQINLREMLGAIKIAVLAPCIKVNVASGETLHAGAASQVDFTHMRALLEDKVLSRWSSVKLLGDAVDLAEGGAYAIFPELKDAMGLIQKEVAERLLAMMAEAQVSQPHR